MISQPLPPRRPTLRDRLSGTDEYGVALVLILSTILAMAALGGQWQGQALAVTLGSVTLLFILRTSLVRPATYRLVVTLLAIAIVAATGAVLLGQQERNPYALVMALLAVVAPVVILRRLTHHATVSLRTVAGALCVYLLIGTFFTSVYLAMEGVSGPFFVQTDQPETADFVYFSYITMTTVGYGDFTAASSLGRMLAVTEALIGQIYLVAGVALLVGNVGRRRGSGALTEKGIVGEVRDLTPTAEEGP